MFKSVDRLLFTLPNVTRQLGPKVMKGSQDVKDSLTALAARSTGKNQMMPSILRPGHTVVTVVLRLHSKQPLKATRLGKGGHDGTGL